MTPTYYPELDETCYKEVLENGLTVAVVKREGFTNLSITNCIYDENNNIQTAEVILKYTYKIPLLGISEIKTTRGIAR